MQVEDDYDLHADSTKKFMRNQATVQHVKIMNNLVRMVEHCTVQKCELPWPGLVRAGEEDTEEANTRPKRASATASAKAAAERTPKAAV